MALYSNRKENCLNIFFSNQIIFVFLHSQTDSLVCRKECIFVYSADVKLGHFHKKDISRSKGNDYSLGLYVIHIT